MHTIKALTLKISAIFILTISTFASSNAQEFETSNFSGTVNTTVSSGLTIRTERNCENLDGFSFENPFGTYVDGSGEGCASALTDAYGNTTTKSLSRNSGQNDDGSMNFDSGDVVSATTKFYTEVLGKTSGGVGVNLSFTGFIDPALDINKPTYAPLTTTSAKEFERGFDLLNAYVYGSSDFDNTYVDWTIGRQVTNWGEATFIPIGMNGFTTNALDLTKLRGPGSTIREALIPSNQITVSTPLEGGLNIEAFYQLEHRAINLDPAGSFYGSEIVGNGSTKHITSGNANYESIYADDCSFTKVGTDATACNAAGVAELNTTAGAQAHGIIYLLSKGLQAASVNEVNLGQNTGVAKTFGSGNLSTAAGAAWTDAYTAALNTRLGSTNAAGAAVGNNTISATGVNKTFYSTNTTGYNLLSKAGTLVTSFDSAEDGTIGQAAYAALETDVTDDTINTYAAVTVRRQDDFIKEARSDGQFGIRLSGYADAGEGFDWSLNYSRFHSKTPYIRYQGKGGIYAGDVYGLLVNAGTTSAGSRSASQANLVKAVQNVQYSSGVCNASMGATLAGISYTTADSDGTFQTAAQKLQRNYDGTFGNYFGATTEQKNASDSYNWSTAVAGYGKIHNAAKCYATALQFTGGQTLAASKGDVDAAVNVNNAMYGVGEVLLAAITPLNMAKFELIYPEDLDALGFSFNTNIAGTAIQGEVTYRPDFPLAHNGGDQLNQIGDVTGAFDTLDMFAFDTLAKGINNNTNNDGTDLDGIVAGVEVGTHFYNPTLNPATDPAGYVQQGERMKLLGLATMNAAGVYSISATVLPSDAAKITLYKNWMASENSGTKAYLGLAGVKKGVFDAAYVKVCTGANGGSAEAAATCGTHTLGDGNYNTGYYQGAYANAVGGAYEFGTVAFNRSTLNAIAKADTTSDYYSTPFVKKDVWSYDFATTSTFSASHPITTMLGADSAVLLSEVGAVAISGLDNIADGYIARNGYQEGMGQEKCNGPFGALVAGGTSFGGAAGGITHLGAGQVDALFGNGGYCEDQNGADALSISYRLIGSATYNNFNNSGWSLSPSVVWAHDPYGYGPASLGGFVEDRMTMSLGLSAKKGSAISMGLNYTAHLEGPEVSATSDRDTLTASMSYSF